MREREVLQYRLQHLPYHEISRKMNMPLSTVKDHARRGMDALLPLEFADEIRKRDMADLDELSRKFKPLALEGDCVAAKRCIEIIELRERLAGNITRSQSFNAEVVINPPPRINVAFRDGRPPGADDPLLIDGPRPMNPDRSEHADQRYPHRIDAEPTAQPNPQHQKAVDEAYQRAAGRPVNSSGAVIPDLPGSPPRSAQPPTPAPTEYIFTPIRGTPRIVPK
jgi:hypothetical protein